jgi:hypothetical protein
MTEMIKRDLGTQTAEQVGLPQQRQALHDHDVARRWAAQPRTARPQPVAQRPDRSLTYSWLFLAVLALAAAVVVGVTAATGSSAAKPQPSAPASSSDWTQLLTSPLSSAPPTPQRPGADWLRDLLVSSTR